MEKFPSHPTTVEVTGRRSWAFPLTLAALH